MATEREPIQSTISRFSKDITAAELARQRGDRGEITSLWKKWADKKPARELLSKSQEETGAQSDNNQATKNSVEVALAGMGRIRHVDANAALKQAIQEKDDIKADDALSTMEEVRGSYEKIGISELLPWTIHGGACLWEGEIAQDEAATAKRLRKFGAKDGERGILLEAIIKTEDIVAILESTVDLNSPEKVLPTEMLANRKRYLGAVSVLGILNERYGEVQESVAYITDGLSWVRRSNDIDPNPHRLASASIKLVSAAINPTYEASIKDRLNAIKSGFQNYRLAFAHDRKASLRALAQAIRR